MHKTHKAILLEWQFQLHFKVSPFIIIIIYVFFYVTKPQGRNKKTKVQIARQLRGSPKVMSPLLGGVVGGYLTPDTRPLTSRVLFFAVFSVASYPKKVKQN